MPIDTPIQLTQGQFNEEMNRVWKNHMSKPVKYTRDLGPNDDGYVVPDEDENWYGSSPIIGQDIQFTPKNFLKLLFNGWKDKNSDTIGFFDLKDRKMAYRFLKGGLWLVFPLTNNVGRGGNPTLKDLWKIKNGLDILWINRVASEGEVPAHDDDFYRLNYRGGEFLAVGWDLGLSPNFSLEDEIKNSNKIKLAISQNCLNLKNIEGGRNIYFYLGDSLEDFNKLKVQSPHFFNWLNWVQDPMGGSK